MYSGNVLFVEGGALRAAFSYGVMRGLRDILDDPFLDTFEIVSGNSASSVAQAYLFSNQFEDNEACYKMWVEESTKPQFLDRKNYLRLLSSVNPYANSDFLGKRIMNPKGKLNFDFKMLRKKGSRLLIPLVNIDTLQIDFFKINDDLSNSEIYDILHAAIYVPIVTDKYKEIKNKRYVDGATLNNFPIDNSYFNGMKKVVVSTTAFDEETLNFKSFLMFKLFHIFGNLPSAIYLKLIEKYKRYPKSLLNLDKRKDVLLINPKKILPDRFDNSVESVKYCIEEGYREVQSRKSEIIEFLQKN